MLTLYSQEEATEMMLTSERKAALNIGRAEGEKVGEKRGRAEGRTEGRAEGEIKGVITMCQEFGKTVADTVLMIAKKFGLSESASHKLVMQYWKN